MAVLLHAERVSVCGVDDGHAGVERGVDGGDRLAAIGPSLNGQRHFAQSDGTDGPVADGTLLHVASPRVLRRDACVDNRRRLPFTTRPRGAQSGRAGCIGRRDELDHWGYSQPLDEIPEGRRSLAQARWAERACPNRAVSFTVED